MSSERTCDQTSAAHGDHLEFAAFDEFVEFGAAHAGGFAGFLDRAGWPLHEWNLDRWIRCPLGARKTIRKVCNSQHAFRLVCFRAGPAALFREPSDTDGGYHASDILSTSGMRRSLTVPIMITLGERCDGTNPTFDLIGELKLHGMKAASDEIMAAVLKRQHAPQRVVGDLLTVEIREKQARSIKY